MVGRKRAMARLSVSCTKITFHYITGALVFKKPGWLKGGVVFIIIDADRIAS